MPTQNWRENIISNLKFFNEDWDVYGVPTPIMNAIDAAYTAGLDDFTSKLKEIRNEIGEEKLEETINAGDDAYNRGISDAQQILTRWIGKE